MTMPRAEVNFERDVHCVMGLPIDAIDMAGAVQRVREAAFCNTRCFVSTPNLNFVMAARDDAAFRDSVLHSDLCLADGMPLVWMARLLGIPIRERVSGAGLFEHLLKHTGPPIDVYFFGGPDGASEAASRKVNETRGGMRCVGWDAPGFGTVEQLSTDAHIDKINQSGAHFVIVSLGAKKGQAWIEHNLARLLPPVVCHLGAVVNFAAGTVQRAPGWVQAAGAEWLWRIKEEPALWRRYWHDGLALVQSLVTRVLPLLIRRLMERSSPSAGSEPTAIATAENQRVVVSLTGRWTHSRLGPLRPLLRKVCFSGEDLEVNMQGATHLDSACLGLLAIASGAVPPPKKLTLSQVPPLLADQIRGGGADYLLPTEGGGRRWQHGRAPIRATGDPD